MENKLTIFVKSNFKIIGKKATKNSKFKGIITADSIFGSGKSYFNYSTRKEAKISKENQEILEEENENLDEMKDYFGYTSRQINKNNYTYTNLGYLDSEEKIKKYVEYAKGNLKQNSCIYELIIAFEDLTTSNSFGLNNQSNYAKVVEKLMPQICKIMNISYDNVIFWQDYHCHVKQGQPHPHIHLNFFEKTKTIKDGKEKISKINLKKIKRAVVKNFINDYQKLNGGIDAEDKLKELNKDRTFTNKKLEKIIDIKYVGRYPYIVDFINKLNSKGRLQYNSVHLADKRKELDEIVERFINDNKQIKNNFDKLMKKCNEYDNLFNQYVNSDVSFLAKKEEEKFKIFIANKILSLKKFGDIKENEFKSPKKVEEIKLENQIHTDSFQQSEKGILKNDDNNIVEKISEKLSLKFDNKVNKIESSSGNVCSYRISQIEKELEEFERSTSVKIL